VIAKAILAQFCCDDVSRSFTRPLPRANELDERFAASRSLERIGSVGKNGDEGGSLIRAEISLIANLNSLQGRKKFPVRVRREFGP